MDHRDHVRLIRGGVTGLEAGTWLDLGSGSGAFTLALADLLAPGGSIISVDRDPRALREQRRRLAEHFPGVPVRMLAADFRDPLEIGTVDGIVMANSLHFIPDRDKEALLARLRDALRSSGRFVLVEYDADHGNPWVPHPISRARWSALASRAGLGQPRLLGHVPSRFLGAIYAAVSDARPGSAPTSVDLSRAATRPPHG